MRARELFFSFAVSQVGLVMDLCGLQMFVLLVQSLTMNDARLTMWLRNAGNAVVEITGGYVTGLIGVLAGIVCVEPGSTSMATMKGFFTEGCSYSVKLLSLFSPSWLSRSRVDCVFALHARRSARTKVDWRSGWMEQMGLEDLEEPVIELMKEEPLNRERERKIVKLLKKLGGKATISVLEIKLSVWIYDSLEGMVIKGLIKVR